MQRLQNAVNRREAMVRSVWWLGLLMISAGKLVMMDNAIYLIITIYNACIDLFSCQNRSITYNVVKSSIKLCSS